MTTQVCRRIAELRAARAGFGTLGLVPTMGGLHEGHLSLVRQAKAGCDAVAVSIFVNPAQFGAAEDLARYPRNLARDLELLEAEGTDLVFTPEPGEVYPPRFAFRVEVGELGDVLEGVERPGHFSAVATVVLKLFNIFQPSAAWFGQKDAQQCAVIRRMARDFNLPLRIEIGETIREPDGLAMSSRNIRLNSAERQAAKVMVHALEAARAAFAAGEREGDALREIMRRVVASEPAARLSYASIADGETLRELERADMDALALLAVQIGTTRLIDNAGLWGTGRPTKG
jgi:pantoate--beta-alanine ligase